LKAKDKGDFVFFKVGVRFNRCKKFLLIWTGPYEL